ncbi:shikimate kinase [Methanobrevibacter wolinii]|uniref:shikimate kinase n=1 Tax=Methanobrevibacter wolinii TaxID=190977 RepID=UPI0005B25485|nr:shikimate kinase [Methanobrevibacter wolinii]MDD5960179.1 shikimate kinase [Methanobrevibacter wolinii]
MKKIVKSLGSATIINAIASGYGSAFGIDLNIECEVKTNNKDKILANSDIGVDTKLMEMCVKSVLNHYGVDCGVDVKTKTNLPLASGLSSSSALSNGVVKATSLLIAYEFGLEPLSDMEILNIAIDTSLDAKVTITGSFDDASASYFGGVVVTDNYNRKLLVKEPMEENSVLIFLVDRESSTYNSDRSRMQLIAPMVDLAFEQAKNKNYYLALNLNGLLYSNALGYDPNIELDALSAGALASGLSGTGSAISAIVTDKSIDKVKDAWSSYEGQIIETKVNNEGSIEL